MEDSEFLLIPIATKPDQSSSNSYKDFIIESLGEKIDFIPDAYEDPDGFLAEELGLLSPGISHVHCGQR